MNAFEAAAAAKKPRDNSTTRVCICAICLRQFTPSDRRNKGLICPNANCRKEWARRSALKMHAGRVRPEPSPRIKPIDRPYRTHLQPPLAAFWSAAANKSMAEAA